MVSICFNCSIEKSWPQLTEVSAYAEHSVHIWSVPTANKVGAPLSVPTAKNFLPPANWYLVRPFVGQKAVAGYTFFQNKIGLKSNRFSGKDRGFIYLWPAKARLKPTFMPPAGNIFDWSSVKARLKPKLRLKAIRLFISRSQHPDLFIARA